MDATLRTDIPARLVESLYAEALVLADEMRSSCRLAHDAEAPAVSPFQRVSIACEALKGTTRLMTVITWLLSHRARFAGEEGVAERPALAVVAETRGDILDLMPGRTREAVTASIELYDRVRRLSTDGPGEAGAGARALFDRLERAF